MVYQFPVTALQKTTSESTELPKFQQIARMITREIGEGRRALVDRMPARAFGGCVGLTMP